MATTIVKTVKPSGGDYTSLSGLEAGEQKDLVAADEILQAQCFAMEDTTSVLFTGWTTDSTRYIHVLIPTAERHVGKWNTSAYRMVVTANGVIAFRCLEDIVVEGLQLHVISSSGSNTGISLGTSSLTYKISHSIIRATATSSATMKLIQDSANSATIDIWNCIVYDALGGSGAGAGIISETTGTIRVYNCTVHNCKRGYENASTATFTVKNAIAQDCTDGFVGTFDGGSVTNVSDIDGDAPAEVTFGNVVFVNETNDDFHLNVGEIVAGAKGTDLSSDADNPFSDDIDQLTRATPWDIGAAKLLVYTFFTLKGTIESFTSTTLTDTSATFDVAGDGLAEIVVQAVDGDGNRFRNIITSNTATVLTLMNEWTLDATKTWTYYIGCPNWEFDTKSMAPTSAPVEGSLFNSRKFKRLHITGQSVVGATTVQVNAIIDNITNPFARSMDVSWTVAGATWDVDLWDVGVFGQEDVIATVHKSIGKKGKVIGFRLINREPNEAIILTGLGVQGTELSYKS